MCIRDSANGATAQRQSSEHVKIVGKTDVQGIDIYVAPGTKDETVYILSLIHI